MYFLPNGNLKSISFNTRLKDQVATVDGMVFSSKLTVEFHENGHVKLGAFPEATEIDGITYEPYPHFVSFGTNGKVSERSKRLALDS